LVFHAFTRKTKVSKPISCYLDVDNQRFAISFFDKNEYHVVEQASRQIGNLLSSADASEVAVVCPLGSYKNTTLEKTDIPEDEWLDTLRWEFLNGSEEELIADDVLVDYIELPLLGQHEKNMVAAFMLPEPLMLEMDRVISDAKAALSSVSLPEIAISALLSKSDTESACAGLVIAPTGSFLLITFKGEIYLTRKLKSDLSLLESMTNDLVVNALIKECLRSINFFMAKFSRATLSQFFYFADETFRPAMSALEGPLSEAFNLSVLAYDFNRIAVSTAPLTLGGQLALGMAVLQHEHTVKETSRL